MKNTQTKKLLVFCSFLLITFSACQQQKEEIPLSAGLLPISVSDMSRIQSKATGSSFDPNDEIGLYVLEQPNTLTDERHVDNMHFVYDGSSWKPDETIYYPSESAACDFIAYYPFRQSALEVSSSILTCTVFPDQSEEGNYMLSDFLVAEKTSVSPSADAVPLVFKHKLAEICVELLPGTAYDSPEELLAENPVVAIKGVATRVSYDMKTGEFSASGVPSDLIPAGTFVAGSDKVTGIHAIVVPQDIEGEHLLLEVRVGGKNYGFTFGTKHTITPATKETYTLTMRKSALQGNISSTIEEWENNSSVTGDLDEEENGNSGEDNPSVSADAYRIMLPDFSKSSVYKAMNGNTQFAEVCREYLYSSGIDNQAVVIYPVTDGITDLSHGYVAKVLDGYAGDPVQGSVHGGNASWNILSNQLTYTPGNKQAVSSVYLKADREISSSVIQGAAALTLVPDVLSDSRDGSDYPVTKIGTQYWMAENLHATKLTDNTDIKNIPSSSAWETVQEKKPIETLACCMDEAGKVFFYNHPAATSAKIAPDGWMVPAIEDWAKLKGYVNENISVLQSAEWGSGSNLTGFSALPYGYRTKDGSYVALEKACFWYNGPGDYEIKEGGGLTCVSNSSSGHNLRCIRK